MMAFIKAAFPLVLIGVMLALLAKREEESDGQNDALLCAALCAGAVLCYFAEGFINWGLAMGVVLLIVSRRDGKEAEGKPVSAAVELHPGEGHNAPDAHV